jgi:type III restriction enzyme
VRLEHDAAVDIVIHVNKLKEGWDVTNLYTIVPLRASASDILTEQTLGRGLRLPFGKRTGVDAIDRLTVIAHDRFDALIQRAREPGSIVMRAITIGVDGDVPRERPVLVDAPSVAEVQLTGNMPAIARDIVSPRQVFASEPARAMARQALTLVRARAANLSSIELSSPSVQEALAAELETHLAAAGQDTLLGDEEIPSAREVVKQVIETVVGSTIEVPDISVVPIEEQSFGFQDFDLAGLDGIMLRPNQQNLLLHEFGTEARLQLRREREPPGGQLPEHHLVAELLKYDDIDYQANAELLFKLAGQVVSRLQVYLEDQEDVRDVIAEHGPRLAEFIHAQMLDHLWVTPTDYEVRVSGKLRLLAPLALSATGPARSFRDPVAPKSETRRHVFAGFEKCCAVLQQFDSDDERELACLLERDPQVRRWIKPGPRQLRIEYDAGRAYEPDFVVETAAAKLLVEVKAHNEMTDPVVLAKARAATAWCEHATEYRGLGQRWSYLLVPDEAITGNATLAGLAAQFTC